MRTWVQVWKESQKGTVRYVPSRRSGEGPVALHNAAHPGSGHHHNGRETKRRHRGRRLGEAWAPTREETDEWGRDYPRR